MAVENRKYQCWALTENDDLIHVDEAHINKSKVFCPNCKCEMMIKCGNKRIHHFAHNYHYSNEKECSYESYLHAFAKYRLKQWFDEAEKIIIHLPYKNICPKRKDCIWIEKRQDCEQVNYMPYNLKDYFTECNIEKSIQANDNRYKADLLLTNRDKPQKRILIEVKVNHSCTEQKKESGERIIEFEIQSEDDVERIISNDIQEDERTNLYGFKLCEKTDINALPIRQLIKFIKYKSGKVYPRAQCSCFDYSNRTPNSVFELTFEDKIGNFNNDYYYDKHKIFTCSKLYNWGIAIAYKLDYKYKNCYLCKYHKINREEKVLSCCMGINNVKQDKALTCMSFSIDEELYNAYLGELKEYYSYNRYELWHKYYGIQKIEEIPLSSDY